jgi:hypothetical protein
MLYVKTMVWHYWGCTPLLKCTVMANLSSGTYGKLKFPIFLLWCLPSTVIRSFLFFIWLWRYVVHFQSQKPRPQEAIVISFQVPGSKLFPLVYGHHTYLLIEMGLCCCNWKLSRCLHACSSIIIIYYDVIDHLWLENTLYHQCLSYHGAEDRVFI